MSDEEHQDPPAPPPPPPPASPPPPPPASPPPPPASAPPPPPPGGGYAGDGYAGDGYADGASAARLPWEERDQIGFAEAIIETAKLLVTNPQEAFSRLRPDGDLVSPLLWAVLMGWVGMFISQIWSLLFSSAMTSMLGGSDFGFFFGSGIFSTIVTLVLAPIFIIIGLFIASGIYHAVLAVIGGLSNSEIAFEGTLKVVSYTWIVSLASIIPFLGGIVSLIAGIILATVGLSTVHRTSIGSAVVAVLVPIFLCLCCIAAFFFLGVGAAFLGGAAAAAAG